MRFSTWLFGLAMTALASVTVHAQQGAFYTVTYIEVAATSAGQAVNLLKTYRDATRKDQGVVRIDIGQRIDRSNQFVVLAVWADQKAYEAHTGTAHAKALLTALAPIDVAPPDTRQHNALAVGDIKDRRGANVTAVTHVDVIPPQKDNGVAAVKQLAEESRKQNGNLRFDVWQQTNRPNHFTVVETWTNRTTFDAHSEHAQTKDFRGKLATMTGALSDERLYRLID